MTNKYDSHTLLSDLIIYMKYARYLPNKKRRETWEEIVDRCEQMHVAKYPDLKTEINEAFKYVREKKVLPSMRSLQFAGKPIDLNPSRIFNCSFMNIDHQDAFSELMFLLLGGSGVGISVQVHDIEKLPEIFRPVKSRRFLINDSIEGWAEAIKVLIDSYMSKRKSAPDFDYGDIRPKGALLKTAGGRAPGPDPLKTCLFEIKKILDNKKDGDKLTSVEVYDICMHIAYAVVSGGIRRSAVIVLFSLDDKDMLFAKSGNWQETNKQRCMSNNSVVLLRHKIDKDTFLNLWERIQNNGNGEPGFMFSNDKRYGINPCSEASLKSNTFCNLTTINTTNIEDQDDFNNRARAAAFIGTLQSGYTNFHYLRDQWQKETNKDSLIGISLTGIAAMNDLLDIEEAAKVVVKENERVAALIGVNKAARCTVVKPEGSSSLVLGCSNGVHAWHNDYYIKRITLVKNEPIYNFLLQQCPDLIEDSYYNPNEAFLMVPLKAPDNAITRKDETALQFLKRIKQLFRHWIIPGHRYGSNKNNISATVTIKENEWDRVGEWMWENREYYTALSILPFDIKKYKQLPLEDITKEQYDEMVKKLKVIDFSRLTEENDSTKLKENAACSGGQCELV